MNLKRIAASVFVAAGLIAGGASAAHADTNSDISVPGPGGCGQLLSVTVYGQTVFTSFNHRDCQREGINNPIPNFAQNYRHYPAPTAAQREACGGVLLGLVYRASDDKVLYRYASCDIARAFTEQGPVIP